LRNPSDFVDRVYRHYGWDGFKHNFNKVEDLHLEDDESFGINGLHDIRPIIERVPVNVRVSKSLMDEALHVDDLLWNEVRDSLQKTPQRHM